MPTSGFMCLGKGLCVKVRPCILRIQFSEAYVCILMYSVLSYAAYIEISKIQTVHQSRNDAHNAVQLLFTRKFIPEMM